MKFVSHSISLVQSLMRSVVWIGGLSAVMLLTMSPVASHAQDGEPQGEQSSMTNDDSVEPVDPEPEPSIDEKEAQSDDTVESARDSEAIDEANIPEPLEEFPTRLPDGRTIEPMGIFPGQMIEVIPESYWPISIDSLKKAIDRWREATADENSSHLRSAEYWIDIDRDTMVSRRSSIDIESLREGLIRRSLGRVNFAIQLSDVKRSGDPSTIPRLIARPDGELYAEFESAEASRTRVDFDWQLHGKPTARGHQFELRIPRTGQTRFVLSVPETMELIALDGVLRSRPGPPSDAGDISQSLEGKRRWYEVDAGGLSTVRFETHRSDLDQVERSMVIRRTKMEYNVEPSGLFWVQRMELSLPVDLKLPSLRIAGSNITSIKVNASDAAFETTVVDELVTDSGVLKVQDLTIIPPPGVIDPRRPLVSVAVIGQSSWNEFCDLPMPQWDQGKVVNASVLDEVRLMIARPLSLIEWAMPPGWTQVTQAVSGRFETHSASGPSYVLDPEALERAALPAVKQDDSEFTRKEPLRRGRRAAKNPYAWSRLQLAEEPVFRSSATWLRFEARDTSLNGIARVEIQVDPERITPVQMKVQPGWDLQSISLPTSGRTIELPSVNEAVRGFWVWPEFADLIQREVDAGGDKPESPDEPITVPDADAIQPLNPNPTVREKKWFLIVELSASRGVNMKGSSIDLPSLWLARIDAVSNPVVAAIQPPSDMNWSGEAILDRSRVNKSTLSERESAFFGGLNRNTLFFRPNDRQTPAVRLATPSVDYGAALATRLEYRNGEFYEELTLKVTTSGRSLERLLVRTGSSRSLPEYQWSITNEDGEPSTSLPTSQVEVTTEDDADTYRINVLDLDLRTASLIARRRYSAARTTLELPIAPEATSIQSEVWIGPGIDVLSKNPLIQMIPSPYQVPPSPGPATDDASKRVEAFTGTRLRYESTEKMLLTVAHMDTDTAPNLVAHEQIRMVASSRGSDRVEATYQVTVSKPLVIDYEPSLQLTSITRDGVGVDLLSISQLPIVLPPREDVTSPSPEVVRVTWERSQFSSSWLRRVRIPLVDVKAAVLRRDYQLISSTDSFAPLSILKSSQVRAFRTNQLVSGVEVEPGMKITLIRRDTSLAFGWLLAIATFTATWFMMQRSIWIVAMWFTTLVAILVLWWAWRFPLIGWLLVPTVAASLLVSARSWTQRGTLLDGGMTTDASDGYPASNTPNSDDASTDLSWASIFRVMGAIIFSALCTDSAWCQLTSETNAAKAARPVTVLVPVDEEGKRSGDMVYVPQYLKDQLFPSQQRLPVQKADLVSAQYTLSIGDPKLVESPIRETVIEADYAIRLPTTPVGLNQVELPIEVANVSRIELIGELSRGDSNRIVRYEASATGHTLITLPTGQSFRLRVTLRPAKESIEGWTRYRMKIPVVFMANLSVDSEINLSVVRVGGDQGRIMTESDLRRWSQPIGPTGELIVDYRIDGRTNGDANVKALQRRYWISAGQERVSIDCEVEPPLPVGSGESFEFVIRDSQMPLMTSSNWQFVSSELYAPNRRLMTVSSVRNNPGPVHLLWTVPVGTSAMDTDQSVSDPMTNSNWSQSISIPEVIAAALGENAPAWVAMHCTEPLQMSVSNGDLTEPLSVDQFLVRWSGYRGRIDRAVVAVSEMPTPVITLSRPALVQVDAVQRLHVTDQQLELTYDATINTQGNAAKRYTLTVPPRVELFDVIVDGKKVLTPGVKVENQQSVRIGDFAEGRMVRVQVVGMASLPSSKRFVPPTYSIQASDLTSEVASALSSGIVRSEVYAITRDRTCDVEVVRPLLGLTPTDEAVDVRDLSKGLLHVATWVLPPDQVQEYIDANVNKIDRTKLWSGQLNVRPKSTRFSSEQLISLSRDSGRWQVSAKVKFTGGKIPDFVDIEIPKRWCESLSISPSATWSQQASTDASVQLLRVMCDRNVEISKMIELTGQLEQNDDGRIGVPTIDILGAGRRTTYLHVPRRLVNEPIQWRTSGVEASEMPAHWTVGHSMPTTDGGSESSNQLAEVSGLSSGDSAVYQAIGGNWAVDLAPLPKTGIHAVAISQDNQILPSGDSIFVVTHWDLSPGSRESIDVRLPAEAEMLGAWVGGKPVDFSLLSSVANSSAYTESKSTSAAERVVMVRVPLTLSRLSQVVRVLVRQKAHATRATTRLPELVDIPVTQNWLSTYTPALGNDSAILPTQVSEESSASGESQRLVSLARSVVESVEMAVDLLADRPSGEVASWLAPWLDRYLELSAGAQHPARLTIQDDEQAIDALAESAQPSVESETDVVKDSSPELQSQYWDRLDQRMAVYASQYLPGYVARDNALLPVSGLDGFQLVNVELVAATNHGLSVDTSTFNDRRVRRLITKVITLILVFGLMFCCRPLSSYLRPIIVHPVFWLGVLGMLSFFVAPPYVAAALVLVALSMPIFPTKAKRNPRLSRWI
ncbi:hypothetical protein Pla22_44130 [Rubripirellula amarantea]|uniref:Uncharacterized protein n=1 Tax=Rubripirellula amarantea TaxID=2527999 RepID=A0A5C5WGI3_9BACT|nr:hypothetical protein [Rubripirellula amarantea]TWT49221.1 hypothetical protein Pla22_44130 [Rubripirellula amarantea]